jgi:hypothetical protein
MQKLRRTGSTFSTSGKGWHPIRLNRHIIRQKGRLHRLMREGLLPAKPDKEAARAECEEAAKTHPIRRV